jgi:hypothetical protein
VPKSTISIPLFSTVRASERAILQTNWNRETGIINYSLVNFEDPNNANFTNKELISPEKIPGDALGEFLKELNDAARELLDMYSRGVASSSCIAALQEYSKGLAELLIPQELEDLLAAIDNLQLLQIISNESWIPWDILFNKEREAFWGQLWSCVRLPSAPAGDDRGRNTSLSNADLRFIINLVGPLNDKAQAARAARLFDWLLVEPALEILSNNLDNNEYLTIASIAEANKTKPIDVIHLMCHTRQSKLTGPYLELGPNLKYWLYRGNIPSIEFCETIALVNSCSVAKPLRHIQQMIVFAWELYLAGVVAMIGPFVDVKSDVAVAFTERVAHFLIDEGLSVWKATLRTKREMLEEGDCRALLFAVYGHPDAEKWLPRG